MLKVEKKVFEKVVGHIITSTDIRELIREFSLYRVFYYSLLSDIAQGRESRHYYILKSIARDRKISEEFIIEQARSVLSHFAPEKPKENYYEMLNVPPTASAEDIRKSWINLMKVYHPDSRGDVGLEVTKKLNEAYELLKDPVKRREYNARLLTVHAEPIVVVSPWTFVRINRTKSNASRKFLYTATLIIVVSAVSFYLVESGLLFDPADKMRESMGPIKGKPEYKVEEDKLAKTDSDLAIKRPSSSEPERKEKEVISSPPKEDAVIFNDQKEADKKEVDKKEVDEKDEFPVQEDKKSLQAEKVPDKMPGEGLKDKKYVIKRGDTLLHLAKRFNTSVKDLKAANGLKDNELRYGDFLIIPTTKLEDVKPIEAQAIRQDAILSSNKEGTEAVGKETEKEALVTRAAPVEIQQSQAPQKEIVKAEVESKGASIERERFKPESSVKEYGAVSYPDKTTLYYFVLEYVSA